MEKKSKVQLAIESYYSSVQTPIPEANPKLQAIHTSRQTSNPKLGSNRQPSIHVDYFLNRGGGDHPKQSSDKSIPDQQPILTPTHSQNKDALAPSMQLSIQPLVQQTSVETGSQLPQIVRVLLKYFI